MFKFITAVILFTSLGAQAQDVSSSKSALIDSLLVRNTSAKNLEGPNCWNTALYALKKTTEIRNTGASEFINLKNKHCKKIEKPKTGSLVRLTNSITGEVHGAIVQPGHKVFQKFSPFIGSAYEKVPYATMLAQFEWRMTEMPNECRNVVGNKYCDLYKLKEEFYSCNEVPKVSRSIDKLLDKLSVIQSKLNSQKNKGHVDRGEALSLKKQILVHSDLKEEHIEILFSNKPHKDESIEISEMTKGESRVLESYLNKNFAFIIKNISYNGESLQSYQQGFLNTIFNEMRNDKVKTYLGFQIFQDLLSHQPQATYELAQHMLSNIDTQQDAPLVRFILMHFCPGRSTSIYANEIHNKIKDVGFIDNNQFAFGYCGH